MQGLKAIRRLLFRDYVADLVTKLWLTRVWRKQTGHEPNEPRDVGNGPQK